MTAEEKTKFDKANEDFGVAIRALELNKKNAELRENSRRIAAATVTEDGHTMSEDEYEFNATEQRDKFYGAIKNYDMMGIRQL